MTVTVIHQRDMQPGDIYIGRKGHGYDGYFGNPHTVDEYKFTPCRTCGKVHQRGQAVEAFKQVFIRRMLEEPGFPERVAEMDGHNIACFCRPRACHGDIYANWHNKSPLRVIVAGSRTFTAGNIMYPIVLGVINRRQATILSGMAMGVDTRGEHLARTVGWKIEQYPADWDHLGKVAGYRRNELMASKANALIAFWDGTSKGTGHMIATMAELHKPLRVFDFGGKLIRSA